MFCVVFLLFMAARVYAVGVLIVTPQAGDVLFINRPFTVLAEIGPSPGSATLHCAQGTDSTLSGIPNDTPTAFTPNPDQAGLCTLTVVNSNSAFPDTVEFELVLSLQDRLSTFNFASYLPGAHFSVPFTELGV